MSLAVKCEAEYRQDDCSHVLELADDEAKRLISKKIKYRCVKCGKYLKNLIGVLGTREQYPVATAPKERA
jgi:phage-related protein